jgi:hypothetical protein
MGHERVTAALARMERVLARLEGIEPPAAAAPPTNDGEVEALRQAYRTLRGKVEAAVGELDGLLAAEAG